MDGNETRRQFLRVSGAAGLVGVAGCLDAFGAVDDSYEVWAFDQGTHTGYVYEVHDAAAAEFELLDTLDTEAAGGLVPHMVDFSSDYAYAAIACTAGQRVLIYRTEDRELVGNVETGSGSHFAGFSPDDEYLHVDVIGEEKIVRIEADLDTETFAIADEINVRTDDTILDAGIESGAPVCHQYDHQGRSIHTLGPGYHDGAVVIVDHDDFSVEKAFSHDELPANCGTVPHPEADKFYLTAGLPSDPEAGEEGVGRYYVLDTTTDEVVHSESTRGVDAHGFWFPPGRDELWVLNRETNNGVVVDPDTDEVIDEIENYGLQVSENPGERDSPDIMWSSPDGEYMFGTLRGPNPVSGDPHAATGVTPGFFVMDVGARETIDVVEPAPGDADSDFHGIGVRPTGETDGNTSPPY